LQIVAVSVLDISLWIFYLVEVRFKKVHEIMAHRRNKRYDPYAKGEDYIFFPQYIVRLRDEWVKAEEWTRVVIPGTTNPIHLADNISAGRGPFPDAKQRKAMIDFFNSIL
jgi:hypothetical protein